MVALDALLKQTNKRIAGRKLASYAPYGWQKDFHDASKTCVERMLMAANRVGKTEAAAAETAIHATGLYPDWWEGKRFNEGLLIWVGALTNEASRDIVQKALLGGVGLDVGSGYIPKEKVIDKPKMKQAGVSNVVDLVEIKHVSGGKSTIIFKTYDQGQMKWQGAAPHIVWMDEEPRANEKDQSMIFSEAQTRILTTKGLLYVTFTPLQGETDLVRYFKYPKTDGVYLGTATWDDAPHLDEDDKRRQKAGYPEHEVDARTKGVPMLGEGRVFAIGEDEIKCDPRDIPPHWRRICGIDFGINHPAAGAWLAHDAYTDTIYVYDCYRKKDETIPWHAQQILSRGGWIPVAWPHDGMNRERKSGKTIAQLYAAQGVSMITRSARYEEKTGGPQDTEPIVMEILQRMQDGRFKVFRNLSEWFEEFRFYHRKDGVIVPIRDDIMKATQYAVMMRRHARQGPAQQKRRSVGRVLA